MTNQIACLELPMRERIVTEVRVLEFENEPKDILIELNQSVPVMWTTSEQTMLMSLDEFLKLATFVTSEVRKLQEKKDNDHAH